MKCPSCGKELTNALAFCMYCGCKLEAVNDAAAVAEEKAQEAVVQAEEKAAEAVNAVQETVAQAEEKAAEAVNAVQETLVQTEEKITETITQTEETVAQVVTENVGGEVSAIQNAAPKAKKSKKGIIIGAISAVVLIAGVVAGIFVYKYMTRPFTKIDEKIAENDVSGLNEIYESLKDSDEKKELEKKALAYAESLRDGYLEEKEDEKGEVDKNYTYEKVTKNLSKLQKKILEDNEDVESMLAMLAKVDSGRAMYAKALEDKERGDYGLALNCLEYVSEDDTKYIELAKKEKSAIEKIIVTDAIKMADEYIASNDYWNAIWSIESAQYTLPDNADLKKKHEELEQGKTESEIDEYLKNASDCAADNNYGSAFYYINYVRENYGESTKVQEAYDNLVAEYKKTSFAKNDEYLANGEYSNSIWLLEGMLSNLPEDEEVTKKLEEAKAQKDVSDLVDDINYYVGYNNFDSAFDKIGQAKDTYGDSNAAVNQIYANLMVQYKDFMYARIEEAALADDYSDVEAYLEEFAARLPEDQDVGQLREYYMKGHPVSLLNQYVLDGFCSYHELGSYSYDNYYTNTDSFDNVYESWKTLGLTCGYEKGVRKKQIGGLLTFQNDGYDKLSGAFAYDKYAPENGTVKFFIIANDNKVYESPIITSSTPYTPFEVEIGECDEVMVFWSIASDEGAKTLGFESAEQGKILLINPVLSHSYTPGSDSDVPVSGEVTGNEGNGGVVEGGDITAGLIGKTYAFSNLEIGGNLPPEAEDYIDTLKPMLIEQFGSIEMTFKEGGIVTVTTAGRSEDATCVQNGNEIAIYESGSNVPVATIEVDGDVLRMIAEEEGIMIALIFNPVN